MEKLNENRISPLVNRGDFTRGIPFYGSKGDFNFTIGRSQFTPGISIKQATLTDLSHNGIGKHLDIGVYPDAGVYPISGWFIYV